MINLDELVAEAREACADRHFNGTYEAGLIRRLADALEAATREGAAVPDAATEGEQVAWAPSDDERAGR